MADFERLASFQGSDAYSVRASLSCSPGQSASEFPTEMHAYSFVPTRATRSLARGATPGDPNAGLRSSSTRVARSPPIHRSGQNGEAIVGIPNHRIVF